MALFADSVRFREPTGDLIVDLFDVFEPEGVEMISRRESFDSAKARVLETARQNYMAVHPVPPNHERRKTHPNLKGDASLLWQDDDRTVLLCQRE